MAPTKPKATAEKKSMRKSKATDGKVAKDKTLYDKYFTASDSIYRSFTRACSAGLKNPDKGPTSTQLAGALLGMENLDEEHLPTEWGQYADKNPQIACCLRRSVAQLRTPKDEKFQVKLGKDIAKTPLSLTIQNPQYDGGMLNPAERTSSKKGKQDSAKVRKPRRKQPQKSPFGTPDLPAPWGLMDDDDNDDFGPFGEMDTDRSEVEDNFSSAKDSLKMSAAPSGETPIDLTKANGDLPLAKPSSGMSNAKSVANKAKKAISQLIPIAPRDQASIEFCKMTYPPKKSMPENLDDGRQDEAPKPGETNNGENLDDGRQDEAPEPDHQTNNGETVVWGHDYGRKSFCLRCLRYEDWI